MSFADFTKDDAKTAGDATDIVSNAILVVAAGATAAGQLEIAAPVAFVGAVWKLGSSILKGVGGDPPRSDFRQDTLLKRSRVTPPQAPSYLTSISELNNDLIMQHDRVRAELQAIERYSGARDAGDWVAARKQLNAAMRFHFDVRASMPKLQRLLRQLAEHLRTSGHDVVFQRSKLTEASKTRVTSNVRKTFQQLGADDKSSSEIRRLLDNSEVNRWDGKKLSDILEATSANLALPPWRTENGKSQPARR